MNWLFLKGGMSERESGHSVWQEITSSVVCVYVIILSQSNQVVSVWESLYTNSLSHIFISYTILNTLQDINKSKTDWLLMHITNWILAFHWLRTLNNLINILEKKKLVRDKSLETESYQYPRDTNLLIGASVIVFKSKVKLKG